MCLPPLERNPEINQACTCTYICISLPDYIVTITFENGSSVSYTVDAATLSVSIDEPAAAGGYSVMVAAINGAGEGQPGAPSIGRKLATIFSMICMYMYASHTLM